MTSPFDAVEHTSQGTDKFYSVSFVSKTVGISPRQLYYWEHLGIIKPVYEEFGSYSYRRYSQAHVDFLAKIKGFLDDGYTLRAAVKKVRENGATHV